MLHKLKSKFTALSRGGKIAVVTAGLVAFGTVATASSNNQSNIEKNNTAPLTQIEQPSPEKLIEPKVETQTKTELVDVPFEKVTVNDATLATGTMAIRTPGVVGKKTFLYEITTTDGLETDKKLISETVTTAPITEVTAKGTKVATPKPASSCSPHYSGCVPIASDVDCGVGVETAPPTRMGHLM